MKQALFIVVITTAIVLMIGGVAVVYFGVPVAVERACRGYSPRCPVPVAIAGIE